MKNLVANIKANKTVIIKRTLVVAATAATIALVAYAVTRNDIAVDDLELVAE